MREYSTSDSEYAYDIEIRVHRPVPRQRTFQNGIVLKDNFSLSKATLRTTLDSRYPPSWCKWRTPKVAWWSMYYDVNIKVARGIEKLKGLVGPSKQTKQKGKGDADSASTRPIRPASASNQPWESTALEGQKSIKENPRTHDSLTQSIPSKLLRAAHDLHRPLLSVPKPDTTQLKRKYMALRPKQDFRSLPEGLIHMEGIAIVRGGERDFQIDVDAVYSVSRAEIEGVYNVQWSEIPRKR